MSNIVTQAIPLDVAPYYEQQVSLENRVFTLIFAYNETAKAWYMDIKDANREPVIDGLCLVPAYPMILDYQLQEYGLNGAFYLLPKATTTPASVPASLPNVGETLINLTTYYELKYIYSEED